MSFNAEDYIKAVTWENFDELKKPELFALSNYYEMGCKQNTRKQIIKNGLIDVLVGDDLLDIACLDKKEEVQTQFEGDVVKLKELDLKMQIELEKLNFEKEKLKIEEEERKAKLEMEKALRQQEIDADTAIKQKELDLKQKELELKQKEMTDKMALEHEKLAKGVLHKSKDFDATKHIRLVPKFQEKEVDKYFMHFEKVATNLKRPKETWTVLLQSEFVGKAQEIYSALPVEKSSDYDEVKQAILKAYELVPEAYRQRFRNIRKQPEQTHVEFARVKEQMLNRWLSSNEVKEDFGQLRQLILIEEFKQCVHVDIKTHLDESKIQNLSEAATRADDYALTHKLSASKPNYNPKGHHNNFKPKQANPSQNGSRAGVNQTDSKEGKKKSNTGFRPKSGPENRSTVTCYTCKKPGHYMFNFNCPLLKDKDTARKEAVGCAVNLGSGSMKPTHSTLTKQEFPQKGGETEKVSENFEPFVLEGVVSVGDDKNQQPIKIMRDTGCAQS